MAVGTPGVPAYRDRITGFRFRYTGADDPSQGEHSQ